MIYYLFRKELTIMKKIIRFLGILLFIVPLFSCESDQPMEIVLGLEEEELVLEEVEKEIIDPIIDINDVYSYSYQIEEVEDGYYDVFRLYKNKKEIKCHILSDEEYLLIQNAWVKNDILYFAVSYSSSSRSTQYILELDQAYDARIIGLPENAMWDWDRVLFKDEFYMIEKISLNQLTIQCFSYEHKLIKEIQFEFDNPNQSSFKVYLIFIDAIGKDIYFILHKALMDQDEYYLYKYSEELILVDKISKSYNVQWELDCVSIQNEEFHFYIHEYEQQFMANKVQHIFYEYSRGILRKIYTFTYEDHNYHYSLGGILFSENHIYLLFTFIKGGWLAPSKFIIFHYDRQTQETTYLYSGMSIFSTYLKNENFYISSGEKVYRFKKE